MDRADLRGLRPHARYGGIDASDAMLSVRWDAPTLAATGHRVGRIGPTGMDFFRVVGQPDTAHLSLPANAPATVSNG